MERMDNRKLNSVGSSRIRIRWLLNHWPEAEEYKIGKEYEVLIFQKVFWGSMMENFKGIKVLDLCFSGDTLVLTKNGWEYIKDIKIGDFVLTHKNRWRKVIKKMVRISDTVKVKSANLPSITATKNHPFLISSYRHNGCGKRINDGDWKFKAVEDLDVAERHKSGDCAASITRETAWGDIKLTKDTAWFLGYYLAEGTYSDHQVSFAMNVKELKHRKKIMDIISSFGYKPTYHENGTKTGRCGHVYFGSKKWVDFLTREIGVKDKKRIPISIFNSSNENKAQFLGSYFSGDGYLMDKGGVTSTSISKKISFGIWQLLKDIGVFASINFHKRKGRKYHFVHRDGRRYNSKPQWRVQINPQQSLKFLEKVNTLKDDNGQYWSSLTRVNNEQVKIVKDYYAHPIRRIKDNKAQPVYNITVEGDHSYIADGLVVANCDPDWLEGKPVFEFIDMCDAVTTSTEALAEYIRKLRPKAFVECVPDRIYIPEHKPVKTLHKGQLKKVCWFGYHHNTHYLMSTFDELIKRNIELTIIATAPYEPPLTYRGRLKLKNVPWDYETLFKEVARHDAVLMPVPKGDEKGKYKSNNKVTQSWSQGMPVVVTPEDLDRFTKPEDRAKESVKRLKEIKEIHDVRFSVTQMRQIIKKIKETKKKAI